ncbi:hypothetical protein BV898_19427 [Hypsibius exemplaris]|uniref:Uncharacterized protein n=1 Tax=Hypsibius exemplaris TaxID=2072580 RepID=A0A9X6RPF6_HYPEX|nr:hypothetical protein BV898_19427 [Hypsibius exemplaris]
MLAIQMLVFKFQRQLFLAELQAGKMTPRQNWIVEQVEHAVSLVDRQRGLGKGEAAAIVYIMNPNHPHRGDDYEEFRTAVSNVLNNVGTNVNNGKLYVTAGKRWTIQQGYVTGGITTVRETQQQALEEARTQLTAARRAARESLELQAVVVAEQLGNLNVANDDEE